MFSPTQGLDRFHLPTIWSEQVETYGSIPDKLKPHFVSGSLRSIPIHPDNADDLKHLHKNQQSTYEVRPTASPRTLATTGDEGFYLKLHYAGVLGRIERSLPKRKAIAEVEISRIIQKEVLTRSDAKFGILASDFCNFLLDSSNDIAVIVRDRIPRPPRDGSLYSVPVFSMFSQDRRNSNDELLLQQIVRLRNLQEHDFLSEFIYPIIDAYVLLSRDHGLIPEWNAQNLLFQFDRDFQVKRVLCRDLMEVEKDIPIRERNGLSTTFDSDSYKCIFLEKPGYFERHSFSFDFKLSHYVIKPLVDAFSRGSTETHDNLIHATTEYVKEFWGPSLREHFQPYDSWFLVPKRLLTTKKGKKLESRKKPLLR